MLDAKEQEVEARLPPSFREVGDLSTAFHYAAVHHHGQVRKGTSRPYIGHPADVAAALLAHYPGRTDLALAGLCHDLVEDTDVGIGEISAVFGAAVAGLVAGVTAPAGHSPAALREASRDVNRLKAADLLSNASETLADIRASGPKVWRRFRGGREARMPYYRDMAAAVRARLRGEPLADELARVVVELDAA